jgi:multimeric flavodoxin WrbA
MRVIAVNGSARKDGNTALLLRTVMDEMEKSGIESELIQLAGTSPGGCKACYGCFANKNSRCAVTGDIINEIIGKMAECHGILLGSPTYFTDVTAEMKALLDRAGMVSKANGDMLKRKAGAAVVSVRRAGALHVFDTLNHFFTISQMIIPGSSYWNLGIGRNPGEVHSDQEGIQTMITLGKNMAWLMKKLET